MSTSSFLDKLPAETRLMIYKCFFEKSSATIVARSRLPAHTDKSKSVKGCVSLLLSCKQIHNEASPAFLRHTRFLISPVSVPCPALDFPNPAIQVSNLSVWGTNKRLVHEIGSLLISRNCKIPRLHVKALAFGKLSDLSFYGLQAPSDLQDDYFPTFTEETVLEVQYYDDYAPKCSARIVTNYGAGGRRCTRLRIGAYSDYDIQTFFNSIVNGRDARKWLSSAVLEVQIIRERPHKTHKTYNARLEEIDGKDTLKW